MPTSPPVAAKAIKNIVAHWAAFSLRAARWLASASRGGPIGEKPRVFPSRDHIGDVTNMVCGSSASVPFDLARCEFYYNGTKFRIVFAPSADVTRLNETLPPADWMELIYANEYGRGVFQVQTRPADSSLKAGCMIAGCGLAEKPVEGPVESQATGDRQQIPLGLSEV